MLVASEDSRVEQSPHHDESPRTLKQDMRSKARSCSDAHCTKHLTFQWSTQLTHPLICCSFGPVNFHFETNAFLYTFLFCNFWFWAQLFPRWIQTVQKPIGMKFSNSKQSYYFMCPSLAPYHQTVVSIEWYSKYSVSISSFFDFCFLSSDEWAIICHENEKFYFRNGWIHSNYTILHGIMIKSCEIDLNSQEISLNDSLRPDFFAYQKYKAKNDDQKGSTEKERNHKSFRVCWWKKIHNRLFERK